MALSNPDTNQSKHFVTSPEFMRTAVFREATDHHATVLALYVPSIGLQIGGLTRAYVVPTAPGSYPAYCDIDMHRLDGGAPDLTTGHAGMGATALINVSTP